ncbi:MAG TPA: hypothetical protein VNT26_22055 [Candidatus Sulfotelmatobacter sp.]|nr:hypothetical protein [Candidatus Sulfotelmatobacter sp.]
MQSGIIGAARLIRALTAQVSMKDEQQSLDEPASNRLAAFLRDCLGGLIALAMIGWLAYFGITAMVTAHLDLGHGARLSRRWFYGPLDGMPAVLAGGSFVCLALAFSSIGASHPMLGHRVPSWIRASYWWFFAGGAILYFTARFISGS